MHLLQGFFISAFLATSIICNEATWIIKMNSNNPSEIAQIAQQHNFEIVSSIDLKDNSGYYVVKSGHHRLKRSTKETIDSLINESTEKLVNHPSVSLFKRETVNKRTKRDFIPFIGNYRMLRRGSSTNPRMQAMFWKNPKEDPMWPEMWYMNRHSYNIDLPDMNVSAAWRQGFSGKRVSVTFLDDGLEYTHPDLKENYDPLASYDINNNDNDPIPRYDVTNENKHGTRCAGEVAASANNSICSVGVAYHSGIGGIRMLDGDVTDSVEARSLVFNRDHIDIYSASWGPDDNGEVVDGPGPLAKQAFEEGVKYGRKGKGSIFVWASGNGGRFNDSCSCDGYANSIYTLSISSTSENSEKPWYLEECTSTLATTYSSGDSRQNEREIVTTDLRHKCTVKHTGTSAAAPIAAGIVALALEANPSLTWRDVMYLTVFTSRPGAIKSNNYIRNKRGFLVSSRYGFGLMDAGRLVELAKNWQNVPKLRSCETALSAFTSSKRYSSEILASITTNACYSTDNEVNYIEQVEIIVTIEAYKRGSVEIYLTSPMGTNALILPRRLRDRSHSGFKNWAFMTVQLWGESPRGQWKLHVYTYDKTDVDLRDFQLRIHGTKTKPVEYDRQIPAMRSVTCNYECKHSGSSCGPTEYDCDTCAHFSLIEKQSSLSNQEPLIKCVSYCPKGYYADLTSLKCVKCNSNCLECNGPNEKNCTSCNNSFKFIPQINSCVSQCPNGFFTNSKEECEICSKNCLTCEFTGDFCTSCVNDTVNQLTLKNNSCVRENACDKGMFYEELKKQCSFCDITCATCKASFQSNCTSCLGKRPFLSEGKCLAKCEKNTYQKDKNCFKCHDNCLECSNNSFNCTKCKPEYNLDKNNRCEIQVVENQKCDDNCYECNGKTCLVCKNGHVNHNGKCLDKSPAGFFNSKDIVPRGIKLISKKCKSTCKLCTDFNICQECTGTAKLINQDCIPECKPNFFANSDGQCIECNRICNGCFNETTCRACHDVKQLLDGKCIDTCPLNYYSTVNNECKRCYPSCQTCNGSKKSDCLTCEDGFKYQNSKCVSECPDGTFYNKNSSLCSVCNSNKCAKCITTAETCTDCLSPLALDIDNFICKPCCKRKVGIQQSDISCCQCSNENKGFCSNDQQSKLDSILPIGQHNKSKSTNNLIIVLSVCLITIGVIICLFSFIVFFKCLFKGKLESSSTSTGTHRYGKVEYSPLNENLEIS